MATIKENEKGFRVIHTTREEMAERLGSVGLCDYCGKGKQEGYLICVLNSWYCPACWISFIGFAKRHPEDVHIEENRFKYYKTVFKIKSSTK